MEEIDIYKERLMALGDNARERSKNNFINSIKRKVVDSVSCKEVAINEVKANLFVNSGSKPYYKEIQSLPGEEIYSGDLVYWSNTNWLITNADSDNEIYIDGNMTQCNWELKWQNTNGDIINRYCVKTSGSNTGVNEDSIIESGANKSIILIPYDADTILLKRGNRFFIDNNLVSPTVYKINGVDNVSFVYNGHGYISLSLIEDEYNSLIDSVENMICNYKNISNNHFVKILSSSDVLRINSKGVTLTAEFYKNDTLIEHNSFTWEIVCDFKDKLLFNNQDSKLVISTKDDSLVNRNFKVILKDNDKIYEDVNKVIKIVGVF